MKRRLVSFCDCIQQFQMKVYLLLKLNGNLTAFIRGIIEDCCEVAIQLGFFP